MHINVHTITRLIFYQVSLCKGSFMLTEKRTITPEKAVEILKKHGTIVTIDEAKLILDFIYKFANLTLNQMFKR